MGAPTLCIVCLVCAGVIGFILLKLVAKVQGKLQLCRFVKYAYMLCMCIL